MQRVGDGGRDGRILVSECKFFMGVKRRQSVMQHKARFGIFCMRFKLDCDTTGNKAREA